MLKAFVFNKHLLANFLAMIDEQNHEVEDNLRSSKLLEQVQIVRLLVDGLGFSGVMDDNMVDREAFMTNFQCNICDDALFKNKKRINELFELSKGCSISTAMSSKQVLNWSNAILKPFSLKLVAVEREGYRLEVQNDMLGVIRRKCKNGYKIKDQARLLQLQEEEDPFMDDDETVAPTVNLPTATAPSNKPAKQSTSVPGKKCKKKQPMASYDTTLLDIGVCDSD